MSYSYQATGDVASTLKSVATIGVSVVQDPALPEVTGLLLKLVALEGKSKGQTTGGGTTVTGKGIGLRYAVRPLKVVVRVREQPWLVPVVGGGLIALIFGLGYATGKR